MKLRLQIISSKCVLRKGFKVLATAFSHHELDLMSAAAIAGVPPHPGPEHFETGKRTLSLTCAVQKGLLLSTLVCEKHIAQTIAFNPASAWHLALTISQLMSLAGWSDEHGCHLSPKPKLQEDREQPTLLEKKSMRRDFERLFPNSPTLRDLIDAPVVIAVSGGGSSLGAILSFRFENGAIQTFVMNQFVAYEFFAMLVAVIENFGWVGSDGKLCASD